jgi:hypothetical protein
MRNLDELVKVSRIVNTPSPDARARNRERLAGRIAAGLAAGATASGPHEAVAAGASGSATGSGAGTAAVLGGGLAKWSLVSVLIAVGGAAGAGFHALHDSHSKVADLAAPLPTQGTVNPAPAIELAMPGPRASDAIAAEQPPRPEPSSRPARPRPEAPSLERELALLRSARRALDTGAPLRALELLDQYAAEFPGGILKAESQATRVFALCGAGRVASARQARDQFLQHQPGSPLAERLRTACGDGH